MFSSEYNFLNFDSEDCTSRGACALSPGIVSLQELVLYFIKQASFYIVKLADFNLHNPQIEDEIINDLASLINLNEYSEKQLYNLAMQCYYIFSNSKNRYINQCKDIGIEPDIIDEYIHFYPDYSMSKAITSGDILVKRLYNVILTENRNFMQILYSVLKSTCQNISKLFDFDIRDKISISDILNLLASLDKFENNQSSLFDFINSLSVLDSKLQYKLAEVLFEYYGSISEVMVSHSTRKGKCILVSGNNFNDLINILELTKAKDIDVYTHSNLLISHSLEKFRKYPHLKGHYGSSSENCIVDYGTFPGAILLTKNSKNNTEFLYRGKIFSNDYITPQGVIKIENNDYSPVIESAISSSGFKKGRQKPDTVLGFNDSDVNKLFEKIFQKMDSGKIRRLFIVGIGSFSDAPKEYFSSFFANLKSDEYVISFYYESGKNNVVTLNIGNYVPLMAYVMNKLLLGNQHLDHMYFIFPACDVTSISGIIKLKNIGASNIYVVSCSPRIINPLVFETFIKNYSVKVLSNPIKDLKSIRKSTFQ